MKTIPKVFFVVILILAIGIISSSLPATQFGFDKIINISDGHAYFSKISLGGEAPRDLASELVVIGTVNITGDIHADSFMWGSSSINISNFNASMKAYVDSIAADTNETFRFINLTGVDCGGTNKVIGVQNNGTLLCSADLDSTATNLFNQWLNTTSNVTFWNLTITKNFTVDAGTFFIDSNVNRIGIGTTKPQEALQINGAPNSTTFIDIVEGSVSVARLGDGVAVGTGGALTLREGGVIQILLDANSNSYFLTGNGNLGVGTTTPQNAFNVLGDANITNTIYWNNVNVSNFNISMKAYLDARLAGGEPLWTANWSILNNTHDLYNSSLKVYVDSKDVTFNTTVVSYLNARDSTFNATMKTYVDAVIPTEDEVEAYIFDNDNTANLNISYFNVTQTNCVIFESGGKICTT